MTKVIHLQRRLIAGSVVVVAGAIVGAGFVVERTVERDLRISNTAALRAVLNSGMVRAISEARRSTGNGPGSGAPPPMFDTQAGTGTDAPSSTFGNVLWAVRESGSSTFLASSADFPASAAATAPTKDEPTRIEATLEGGDPVRVVGLFVYPADHLPPPPRREGRPGGPPGRRGARGGPPGPRRPQFGFDESFEVFVAGSIAQERSTLSSLRRTLSIVGGGAILGLSALLFALIRLGLRPLTDMARAIDNIEPETLREPLPISHEIAELAPITNSLAEARSRLADGFEREQRFAADAAHELRTPLAGLRASLEVSLRRERTTEHYRASANECLSVVLGMQGAVDALLMLARIEGGEAPETSRVDVAAEAERAFEALAGAMEERGVRLVIERPNSPADCTIDTAAPLLERLLANAAGNAVAHCTADSQVHLLTTVVDRYVVLRTANTTAAMPDGAAELVVQPFWRADESRTGVGAHAGLGLPLIVKIAEALGGEAHVTIDAPAPEGTGASMFTLEVKLPRGE